MTSQPIASTEVVSFSFESFIRGYHAYREQWEPWVGEVLRLERDPTNQEDINAVAIINASGIVAHVPFNLAPIMSALLRRPINKEMAEVTGNRVNRGAGYGLEIPCKYHFFGSSLYIERLKIIVDKQRSDGLL